MFFHSFGFNLYVDQSDAEMLDYQYGVDGSINTHFEKERVALGQAVRSGNTTGTMPRGDYVYAKWRNLETKKIYEDRVDIRDKLPTDMTGYAIHLFIKGSQLFVYLIPPPGQFPSLYLRQTASAEERAWLQQKMIYPAQAK